MVSAQIVSTLSFRSHIAPFLFSESQIVILMLLLNAMCGHEILEIKIYFECISRMIPHLCINEGDT